MALVKLNSILTAVSFFLSKNKRQPSQGFGKSLTKVGILSFTILLVSNAFGQITTLNTWTNVYHAAGTTQSATYAVPTGSNSYRVLVVAIASSQTTVGSHAVTLTYGGQALTSVNGDMANAAIRDHTQLFYLTETGLDAAAAASNSTLSFSIAGGTTVVNDVFVAVFDGVDQTSLITDSKNYNSNNANTTNPVFATALNLSSNDLAIEIISSVRTGSTTPYNITYATNWSMATTELTFGVNVAGTNYGVRNAIGSRTPSASTTDLSSTTFSGASLGSMTAMSLNAVNAKSWYSYKTGNFSDYKSWTLDPSGTTFFNGLHLIPRLNDDITILNGKTITSDVNNLTLSSTTIQGGGVLDMVATTGHNLGVISGTGLLRVKGNALPLGTYTDFVATSTGTVEYYDASVTLPTAPTTTYNNLLLTNSTGNVTYILDSDLTVNGTFDIGSTGAGTATWQINGTGNNSRTINLNKDLIIGTNGRITAGSGNNTGNPHNLTIYGDLLNSGIVRFGNPNNVPFNGTQTAALTAGQTGRGVNVTFTGSADQTVTCNGQTDFYRFIVNKGTTQQPKVTVNSLLTANFRLFGRANHNSDDFYGETVPQNPGTAGALSLLNGTLRLKGSIDIPSLVEDGGGTGDIYDFFGIPASAALWLDDPTVSVTATQNVNTNDDQRLIVNGLFKLTNGTFNSGYSKGLGTTAGGTVLIEGGIANIWQYRTVYAADGTFPISGVITYTQTGGTVNIGTDGTNSTPTITGINGGAFDYYARFSLANANSVFQMSDGDMHIGPPTAGSDATSKAGGLDIQGNAYSVTGGNIYMYIPTGTDTNGGTAGIGNGGTGTGTPSSTTTNSRNFTIYSTAPLYNVNIYRIGSVVNTVTLGTTVEARLNSDLTVLNNLTLYSIGSPTMSTILNTNGNNDLTVGGNFIINANSYFRPSTGTGVLTFNGTGAQSWTNSGTISAVIPVVVVDKTGTLTLTNPLGQTITGLTLTNGTFADNGNTINVTGTLTNNATHTSGNGGGGSITYSAVNGTIGGNDGTFGNLTLSGNNSVTVMSGNQTVTGNLSLTGNASAAGPEILYIGSNNLTVGGTITSSATFGHNSYILTSGLHNAGGLTRTASAAADVVFPLGVLVNTSTAVTTTANRLYTPNTINVNSATTFGTITVRPVNNVHPNVTTPSASLAYYWRVTSSGFTGLGTVEHRTYQFFDGSIAAGRTGTLTTYRAARYDRSNNTWGYYNGGGGQTMNTYILTTPTTPPYPFNTATNWSTPVGSQLDGEYTCGNSNAFGSVTAYYSITTGNWNANGTWSTTSNSGTSCVCFPPAGTTSPVIIGDGSLIHIVTIPNGSGAAQMCGTLSINAKSTLDCGTNTNTDTALGFGTNTTVGSTGTLKIGLATSAGTAGHFPSGDFTNFIGSAGGTVEYYGTTTTNLTIPATYKSPVNTTQPLNTYNNLVVSVFTGQTVTLPASSLTIYNDFTQGSASSYTGKVVTNGSPQTISVGGDLTVSYGAFNFINTPSTSTTTLNVTGNIINNGTFSCAATATTGTQTNTHLITVFGSITNNNVMNLRQFNAATRYNYADITFAGTNSVVSFGGTGAGGTTLDLVTINKGTSQAPTVTCSLGGAFNTTAVANGWLTLTNGTFDFANTSTVSTTLSNSTSYTIPSTTKLRVSGANVTVNTTSADATGNDLFLSGSLEVAGGTVNVGSAAGTTNDVDIEYASSGTPTINISGGLLWVRSSIRRSTSVFTGALVYNQTGGTVTAGGIASNNTRGVFEIDENVGSSFTLTGGTLNVQRQTGGTGYADVYINPETSNVTSASKITVGLSTATTQSNLRVNIVPAIGDFSVQNGGGTNAQTVLLYNDLIVGGILTIPSPSVLNTTTPNPDANVTVAGNFVCGGFYNNNGSPIANTTTTTFNGTGAQSAVLTSTTNLYNVTVNKSAGALSMSGTAPTAPGLNNLSILSGTLDVSTNVSLKVNRSIIINGAQTGTVAIEVYSTGITNTITGSSSGSFTNLTLGGTVASATVGVSGNLIINGTLNLLNNANGATSRYLYIGSSQLTFGSSASPLNAGTTAFIKTNGIAADLGVVKNWASSGTFVYAVGTSSNYTPVSCSLSLTHLGTLTVVPVNSAHTTYDQSSKEQILNYYWTVKRSGSLDNATASGSPYLTFSYPQTLVSLGSGLGTLVAAYLDPESSPLGWAWSPANGGAASTTLMSFNSTPTTNFPAAGKYYDYSVGTQNTLPHPIAPVYSKLISPVTSSGGGDWTTNANWTYDSDGDPNSNGTDYQSIFYDGPHGLPVVILPTAQINLDQDGQIAYKTTIDGGGTLYNLNTAGHYLGIIDGTGTFRTATGTLPGGVYDAFVSSSGGTIEYAATTQMDPRTTYNNLTISNSASTPTAATVTMTTSNLVLNGNLTVGGGNTLSEGVNPLGSGNISIAGNFSNAGTFLAGSSAVSIAGSMTNTGVFTAGSGSSTVNIAGNLTNNGVFTGSGSSTVSITGNLTTTGILTVASGQVNLAGNFSNSGTFTAGTGTVTLNGTTAQTITGATTFNNLTINNTYTSGTSPQITISSGDQTVGSTLTMTKGNVNLNGKTMTIGTSCASTATAGAVSYSAGWVYGGSLTRNFTTGTIPDGSLTGFFPVGTVSNFRPFSISATSAITGCGTFSLGIVGSATSTTAVTISDSPKNILLQYQGGWPVSSSGVTGGTYNIIAGGTGFGTIGSLLDVTLCKATSAVGTYVAAIANSTSDPRMKRTGLVLTDITTTDGNQFFVGSTNAANSPLPIELLSFTGEVKKYGVDLQWETASEMNCDYFTVLHSASGAKFESIGTVKGNGTTNSVHTYSLLDSKPTLGKNYYQLKQTDFDGHVTTSETIVVNVLGIDPLVSIYPNPLSSSQMLNVVINGLEINTPTEIQVVSTQGTTVRGSILNTDSDGTLKTSIELTGLSAGLYILKVQNVHYKFVIE